MISIWIGHALKYFNPRVHAFNDNPFVRKLFVVGLLSFAQRMKLVYSKISKIRLNQDGLVNFSPRVSLNNLKSCTFLLVPCTSMILLLFCSMITCVFIIWRFLFPEYHSFCFFRPLHGTLRHIHHKVFNGCRACCERPLVGQLEGSGFISNRRLNTTPFSCCCFLFISLHFLSSPQFRNKSSKNFLL